MDKEFQLRRTPINAKIWSQRGANNCKSAGLLGRNAKALCPLLGVNEQRTGTVGSLRPASRNRGRKFNMSKNVPPAWSRGVTEPKPSLLYITTGYGTRLQQKLFDPLIHVKRRKSVRLGYQEYPFPKKCRIVSRSTPR